MSAGLPVSVTDGMLFGGADGCGLGVGVGGGIGGGIGGVDSGATTGLGPIDFKHTTSTHSYTLHSPPRIPPVPLNHNISNISHLSTGSGGGVGLSSGSGGIGSGSGITSISMSRKIR